VPQAGQAARDLARTAIEVGFVLARLRVADDDLADGPALTASQAHGPPLPIEIGPEDGNHEVAAAALAVDEAPGSPAAKGAQQSRGP
jgi:hypothetical protein